MIILEKEVELGVNYFGEFTNESLQALVNNHLIHIENNEVYFYSQKDNKYIFLMKDNGSVDDIVIKSIDSILENEMIEA